MKRGDIGLGRGEVILQTGDAGGLAADSKVDVAVGGNLEVDVATG